MLPQVCLEAWVGGGGGGAVGALVAVGHTDLLLPPGAGHLGRFHAAYECHSFCGASVLGYFHLLGECVVPLRPDLVGCHVLLHIRLLRKPSSTYHTLVRFLTWIRSS